MKAFDLRNLFRNRNLGYRVWYKGEKYTAKMWGKCFRLSPITNAHSDTIVMPEGFDIKSLNRW